jgi:hypothetical protein
MKKAGTLLAAALLIVGLSSSANAATIVNFDDIVGNVVVADGYGGINWGGVWSSYDFAQDPYNPHSGDARIYNNTRTSPTAFSFVTPDAAFHGGWFSGFPVVSGNPNLVHFEMWNNGALVATSATLAPTNVPAFLASGYAGAVDEVRVFSTTGDFYVLDDITYDQAVIPEPASILLLGAGLAGIRRLRRRQVE